MELVRDRCRESAQAGFDCVELALPAAGPQRGDYHDNLAEDLAETLAGAGVRVATLSAGCSLWNADQAAAEVEGLLRYSRRLGAEGLNLLMCPGTGQEDARKAMDYADAANAAHMVLSQVRVEAERTGVMISLEACTNRLFLSPIELRQLIDELSAWPFGACIDLERAARSGLPEDWLWTLRQRVRCIRLPGPDSPDTQSSAPDIDPGSMVTALDDIRYQGPIICSGQGDPSHIRHSVGERFHLHGVAT